MSLQKLFLFSLILCALAIAGCNSNSAVSSGFGSGSGFSINLTATQTNIPQGGQTTLIALVRDGQGIPVNDSTGGVVFTSSLGGTFVQIQPINILAGAASITYTAPTAANPATPGVDQITASYRGASAFVSVFVFRP